MTGRPAARPTLVAARLAAALNHQLRVATDASSAGPSARYTDDPATIVRLTQALLAVVSIAADTRVVGDVATPAFRARLSAMAVVVSLLAAAYDVETT